MPVSWETEFEIRDSWCLQRSLDSDDNHCTSPCFSLPVKAAGLQTWLELEHMRIAVQRLQGHVRMGTHMTAMHPTARQKVKV